LIENDWSDMQVFINHGSGVPAWKQIFTQVKNLVAAGALVPGEKLPSVRFLAKELGVNPITTARAYRELEAEGTVETRKGAGTFITEQRLCYSPEEIRRRLEPHVDELLVNSSQMGMSFDALLDLVRERRETVFKSKEKA
jgi:GntR family transcriptional regulator